MDEWRKLLNEDRPIEIPPEFLTEFRELTLPRNDNSSKQVQYVEYMRNTAFPYTIHSDILDELVWGSSIMFKEWFRDNLTYSWTCTMDTDSGFHFGFQTREDRMMVKLRFG